MKNYDFDLGKSLKLESYVMRVRARTKREAIRAIKKTGFNAGERLSSSYSGDFKPIFLEENKQ